MNPFVVHIGWRRSPTPENVPPPHPHGPLARQKNANEFKVSAESRLRGKRREQQPDRWTAVRFWFLIIVVVVVVVS